MKRCFTFAFRLLVLTLVIGLASHSAFAAKKRHRKRVKAASHSVARSRATAGTKVTYTRRRARRRGWVQTWDEPTYKDSTIGDDTAGEDPQVRKAAIGALGPMNGSVVVVDPTNGRILTMVNQQLALGGGFQPCSTIKVSVAHGSCRGTWAGRAGQFPRTRA